RRDRLHAQLAGVGGVLVDVDLDQLDLALGGQHRLFQRRTELATGAAPGGPEVDDDGGGARGLQDVLGEAGVAAVLDRVAGRRACGLADECHSPRPVRFWLETFLRQDGRMWAPLQRRGGASITRMASKSTTSGSRPRAARK